MSRIYSEENITWSSIEKYIPYFRVEWYMNKNGIATYKFFNKDGNKMDINDYIRQ